MSAGKTEENIPLPHHEQLALCETRLPYRQGRKLTAVKTYTINNESNHLLVWGVPSLNLRREAKDLFNKYGELIHFYIVTDYPTEQFTETYHACFQRIQSARIAKRMLDTKNFYGGSLHICYAPELETTEETRAKLLQRRNDVLYRLRNLQKVTLEPHNDESYVNNEVEYNSNINNQLEYNFNVNNVVACTTNIVNTKDSIPVSQNNAIVNEVPDVNSDKRKKVNMGENNVIYVNKYKRINKKDKSGKRVKSSVNSKDSNEESVIKNSLDIVDCTSVDKQVVSNINDALNYNTFGNEVIRKVDLKPMNKIVFNLN